MSTIAIYSLKGGVGKTTIAVNLAWSAAIQSSRRTLLWDLDPQAASSFLLSPDADQPRRHPHAQSIFVKDGTPDPLIQQTAIPRLDLIAADASLRGLDLLFHEMDKKKRLQKLLSGLRKTYDRILLDCPPGLTETTEQVMRAADLIVVPVIPSPLSERALADVIRHLGGRTDVMPVYSMVDGRRKLHADALARNPDWPVIPTASLIEQVTARRAPIGSFAPRSAGAAAFSQLWQAIERRIAA